MALPLIFVVVGGQAFRIAATTAGKKIVQQLLKRGGKKVTEQAAKKVTKSPVTVTVQNIAKVLKDTRVKPSNTPKSSPITKPKPSSAAPKKPSSAPSVSKPNIPSTVSKPNVTTSVAKPKSSSTKDSSPFKPRMNTQMKNQNSAASGGLRTSTLNPGPEIDKTAPKPLVKNRTKPKKTEDTKKTTPAKDPSITPTRRDDYKRNEPTRAKPKKTEDTKKTTPAKDPSKTPTRRDDYKNYKRDEPTRVRPKKRPATGPATNESFSKAFARNRANKKHTFTWKGKEYTTRYKEETVTEHNKKFKKKK